MARALAWIRTARSGAEGVAQVEAALRLADDAEEARLMALALARVDALEALARVLEAGTDAARDAVVEALPTASGSVGEVALAAARDEASPWRRRRLAALAAQQGADVRGLWDPDAPLVCAALLEHLTPEAARGWSERLEAAVQHGDAEVAWRAVVHLGHAGDLGVGGVLEEALEHDSPFVRAQAARALVRLGLVPTVEIPGLWREDVPLDLAGVRALDDTVPHDVERAALALGLAEDVDALLAAVGRLAASDTEAATTALLGGTDHPVPTVRAAALRALDGRTGEAVWRAYDRRVRLDPDPAVRTGAVWTVTRRRELEALPWIIRWADHDDPAIHVAAVEGLAVRVRRTARSRTAQVRAALERARDRGEAAARQAVEAALGRLA